jgi:HAE1 family hydrophobic/amphiphilic exporter-1
VDHYQIRRTLDIFVRPHGEDLGRIADGISKLIAGASIPNGVDVYVRGSVEGMRASLTSFSQGLALSLMLLYLIMVAQFRSFTDPFLILLAFPPALTGVILTVRVPARQTKSPPHGCLVTRWQ